MQLTEEELKIAIRDGIIDVPAVEQYVHMKKREEYLAMHNHSIYQGKDGKWYTSVPDLTKKRKVRIIKRATREDIENEVVLFWKGIVDPPIADIFNEWNDSRLELKKISPATHLRDQQIFAKHYSELGQKPVTSMSVDDFVDFLELQICEHNMTSKAFCELKRITKGIIKRAKRKKLIDYTADDVLSEIDVSDKMFKKTIKEDYEEVFDEYETELIMNYLSDSDDIRNLGILFMFVSGLRVGELVALKKSDFFGNTVSIRRTESRVPCTEGKRKYSYIIKDFPKTQAGVRTVAIPEEYKWLVKKLTAGPDGFIFVEKGVRLTTNAIRKRLKKVCTELGIRCKSPHKIRKTYGSILLDSNIDRRMILGQMGHTDIACTENHYHRNRKSYDRKVEIISAIPEFQKRQTS